MIRPRERRVMPALIRAFLAIIVAATTLACSPEAGRQRGQPGADVGQPFASLAGAEHRATARLNGVVESRLGCPVRRSAHLAYGLAVAVATRATAGLLEALDGDL